MYIKSPARRDSTVRYDVQLTAVIQSVEHTHNFFFLLLEKIIILDFLKEFRSFYFIFDYFKIAIRSDEVYEEMNYITTTLDLI